MQIVGAVLVGGRSRRFGSPKALAPTPSGPLGSVAIGALRDAGVDPVIVVGHPERDRPTAAALGVALVADRRPDDGPLGGLVTVLAWATEGAVVVVPCDLTDIDGPTIEALLARRDDLEAGRAVIALGPDGRPDPTVAVWPAARHRPLREAMRRGERRWRAALESGPFVTVPVDAGTLSDADDPETLRARFGHDDPPPRTGNEP